MSLCDFWRKATGFQPAQAPASPAGLAPASRKRLLLPVACLLFLALSVGLLWVPPIREWLFHRDAMPESAPRGEFRWEILPSPAKQKDEVFDRVWVLTWDARGKVAFQNLPQRLLPGDSKK